MTRQYPDQGTAAHLHARAASAAWAASFKSLSWKLRVRGAEALTDGSAGDLNGNSGDDDSLHTMHTQVPPMLAARVKKHDVGVKLTLIRRISGHLSTVGFLTSPAPGCTQVQPESTPSSKDLLGIDL